MNIYDTLLGGLGIALVITMVLLWLVPPAGFVMSVITIGLVGSSLFVFTPTDPQPYPIVIESNTGNKEPRQ